MQYLSPTIGLHIEPTQFVSFCENLNIYLNKELKIIEKSQKKVNSEWGYYDCYLGDIKVEFRHYRSAKDAIEKWNRRVKRVVSDNIILKLSYYDNVDKNVLDRFLNIPYKKILFTNDESSIRANEKLLKCVFVPNSKMQSEFLYSDSKLRLKEIKRYINE